MLIEHEHVAIQVINALAGNHPLTSHEAEAYNAALLVLADYLNREVRRNDRRRKVSQ